MSNAYPKLIGDCNLLLRRCRWLILPIALLPFSLAGQEPTIVPPTTTIERPIANVEGTTDQLEPTKTYGFNWLSFDQLSVQQKQKVAPYCRGLYSYSTTTVTASSSGSELAQQPIRISADQISHEGNSRSRMSGDVEIRQGTRLLSADKLTVDSGQGRLELQDKIEIIDPEMVLLAEQASVDLNGNESTLKGARYLLLESQMRGTAKVLERDDKNRVLLTDGSFSSCEPGDQSWVFYADKIELDMESGFGSARQMHLEVAGFPVFYAPYIYFPIDDQRHTGFLMPSVGSSSSAGLELVTPYYVNLASHYDLTLTPRLMSKRGLLLDTEFRYLGKANQGRIDLGLLPSDSGDIDPVLGLSQYPDRWLVGWHHNQQFGTGWSSAIQFNRVSDIDYFRDLEFSGLIAGNHNHLNQHIWLGYDNVNWSFSTQYQRYQTIDLDLTKPYGIEPSIALVGRDILRTMHSPQLPLELNISVEYIDFYRDNSGRTGTERINGKRISVTPELRYSVEFSAGYIRPALKLWYLNYDLSDQLTGFDPEPEITVPVLSVDAAIAFEKRFKIGADDWLQIVEPRAYFLAASEEDQSALPNFDSDLSRFSYSQLFRDNRFSGSDRIGDTQQLSLALSSQWLNSTGRTVWDTGVGRTFYFTDRTVMLSGAAGVAEKLDHSPIAGYLRYSPSNTLDLTLAGAATNDEIADANIQLVYRKDERHFLRFGYRFNRADGVHDEIEQPVFSTLWGLDDRWTLVAHWDYDVAQNRTLDALLGLQYDECCWMVSVHARNWLTDGNTAGVGVESNNALFFQFQLKGFGGIGERLDQLIQSKMAEF